MLASALTRELAEKDPRKSVANFLGLLLSWETPRACETMRAQSLGAGLTVERRPSELRACRS